MPFIGRIQFPLVMLEQRDTVHSNMPIDLNPPAIKPIGGSLE